MLPRYFEGTGFQRRTVSVQIYHTTEKGDLVWLE
jgi:hypothetical protein